ncbi:MAG: 2,3,4,5-tetrahydropyridine-2,6-dicarboxylate N-succinyltransferase [Holosporales bacterium]|jgi:2,3,4,5-tetrahydropyridine-2-carboxylate N-succinyltransferase|nr:2,3,4,5-tetrahydropyridine-2,6-dicarboxylate N-succinyltransferase [Holosporales bacterium]
MQEQYRLAIESAWQKGPALTQVERQELVPILENCLSELDAGHLRIAIKTEAGWKVDETLKKGLSLLLSSCQARLFQDSWVSYWDRISMKTAGWTEAQFQAAGFRICAGAIVRCGAYIAPSVALMPSFVNMGAYIDEGTLIDSWATVGSCAQVGKWCHISEGAALGGVLEPIQALPVIIEDHCFIGGRAGIFEGVHVGEGAVISSGVIINASTHIIDRATGKHTHGFVPPYAVVVPGSYETAPGLSLACAVIVKMADEQTRAKTSLNFRLRTKSEKAL